MRVLGSASPAFLRLLRRKSAERPRKENIVRSAGRMDEIKEKVGHLRKTQGPVALSSLQAALTDHVEDMNRRLQAGLAVRQTQMAFEVLGPGTNSLLRVSLTKENNIHYAQFVKRQNQTQSGVIYVRTSQGGTPAILFSDFPRPNVEVSYQEASKRLLDCSF